MPSSDRFQKLVAESKGRIRESSPAQAIVQKRGVVALAEGWWLDRRPAIASMGQLAAEKYEAERRLCIATFDPARW
jgi:hypothetical protein